MTTPSRHADHECVALRDGLLKLAALVIADGEAADRGYLTYVGEFEGVVRDRASAARTILREVGLEPPASPSAETPIERVTEEARWGVQGRSEVERLKRALRYVRADLVLENGEPMAACGDAVRVIEAALGAEGDARPALSRRLDTRARGRRLARRLVAGPGDDATPDGLVPESSHRHEERSNQTSEGKLPDHLVADAMEASGDPPPATEPDRAGVTLAQSSPCRSTASTTRRHASGIRATGASRSMSSYRTVAARASSSA